MLIDPSGSFRPKISVPENAYQPALRDGPIARIQNPMLVPEATNEQVGQVDQVVFVEGLVQFKGKWYLHYGQGDSDLGVATADVQPQASSACAVSRRTVCCAVKATFAFRRTD
jgi:beta-1,4-mannooligosaccharide phosphorylase